MFLHNNMQTSSIMKVFNECFGNVIPRYGFDQQGWYGMFVACGIWCLADVSSVSPSLEQTQRQSAPTKG